MSHQIKIKSVETAYSQASNSHFIDVEVEVYDGEELVGTRKFGYPTDTSADFIKEEMAKLEATLDSDKEIGIASAEVEAQLKNAASVKEELLKKIYEQRNLKITRKV